MNSTEITPDRKTPLASVRGAIRSAVGRLAQAGRTHEPEVAPVQQVVAEVIPVVEPVGRIELEQPARSRLHQEVVGLVAPEAVAAERARLVAEGVESDDPRFISMGEGIVSFAPDDPRVAGLAGELLSGPRLAERTWLSGDHLPRSAGAGLKIIYSAKTPVTVPLANVVSASGLQSWRGRSGADKVSEHDGITRSSAETIEHYAGLPTDIPPVESITGYVQPNGLVFYSVGAGAHRAAAAVARGSESLQAKELRLYAISTDYYSLQDTMATQ